MEKILAAIPRSRARDRLLLRLLTETGLRVGEALGVHVDDLDLSVDDERISVLGKGGRRCTVLLDDPRLVAELRRYLKPTGYTHGPLFRAEKNSIGGPLRYSTVQEHWARYTAAAGVTATLHQLRHAHATELVNGGVSLPTIRKRLGHRNIQTTLRYAEQSDATADAELRAWRREKGTGPMVTVHGSPLDFIVGGALVILTNHFWGQLYTWVAQALHVGLLGRPLPSELNGPIPRACRASTVVVGVVLMAIGLTLLISS